MDAAFYFRTNIFIKHEGFCVNNVTHIDSSIISIFSHSTWHQASQVNIIWDENRIRNENIGIENYSRNIYSAVQ